MKKVLIVNTTRFPVPNNELCSLLLGGVLIFLFIFFPCISYATNIPTISGKNAIAIEANSGRILYEKNGFSKASIASTTKIMTLIVSLENNLLDDTVVVSKKAAWTGGSSVDLKEGDKIKLSELLYGLMLNSGNDAAVALCYPGAFVVRLYRR